MLAIDLAVAFGLAALTAAIAWPYAMRRAWQRGYKAGAAVMGDRAQRVLAQQQLDQARWVDEQRAAGALPSQPVDTST